MNHNDIITIIIKYINKKQLYNLLQVNKEYNQICISSLHYIFLKCTYLQNNKYLKSLHNCNNVLSYCIQKYDIIYNLQHNLSPNKYEDNGLVRVYSHIINNMCKKSNIFWTNNIIYIIQTIRYNIRDDKSIYIYNKLIYFFTKLYHKLKKKHI